MRYSTYVRKYDRFLESGLLRGDERRRIANEMNKAIRKAIPEYLEAHGFLWPYNSYADWLGGYDFAVETDLKPDTDISLTIVSYTNEPDGRRITGREKPISISKSALLG